MTNFEKITASPERLAKELVYLTFFWDESEGEDKFCWVSHTARGDAYFGDKAEAMEHTLDWLNQEGGG